MEVPITDIEDCLEKVALLCEEFGDEYWPTFQRLEAELEERRTKLKRLRSFSRFRRLKKLDDL